jgi:hypothetical protein
MFKILFYGIMGGSLLLNAAGIASTFSNTLADGSSLQTPTPTTSPTPSPTVTATATPVPTPCFPDDPKKPCPSPTPTAEPLPTASPTMKP